MGHISDELGSEITRRQGIDECISAGIGAPLLRGKCPDSAGDCTPRCPWREGTSSKLSLESPTQERSDGVVKLIESFRSVSPHRSEEAPPTDARNDSHLGKKIAIVKGS